MNALSINAVRYEALFVSALQRSEHPSVGQVQRAISGSPGLAFRAA
jgi:hypothetical protein